MKKLFLSAAVAIFATLTVNAQSLKLGLNGNYIESGSELYYFGTPIEGTEMPTHHRLGSLKVYFQLTNLKSEDIQIEGNNEEVSETPADALVEWCAFGKCVNGPISASAMEANYTEGLDSAAYINAYLNDTTNAPASYRFTLNIAGNAFDAVNVTIHFVNRADSVQYENDTLVFVSGGITGSVPGWGEGNDAAIDKLASASKISTYPNPASDRVNFNLGNEKGRLTIYSTTGKVVYKAQDLSGTTSVDVKNFASGVYFYSFENAAEKITGKLIVK